MSEPQRDGESPFTYLARLQAEHDAMKPAVGKFRRWRFKGRKPNGKWWARTGYGSKAADAFADTAEQLIQALNADTCEDCGHRWARHDGTCCTGWFGRGAMRRACECVKVAPPTTEAV